MLLEKPTIGAYPVAGEFVLVSWLRCHALGILLTRGEAQV